MKRIVYPILASVLVSSFYGCKEEEAIDYAWRDKNNAFLDSLATVYKQQEAGTIQVAENDSLYKLIPQYESAYPIYYKKLGVDKGYVGGGEFAKFTQTATVYYKGKLIDGTVFDGTFSGEYPNPELDHTFSFLISGLQASSSGVIYGWTEILQVMRAASGDEAEKDSKKGDFFRVYIPSELAYGEAGSTSIPGYSVLEFDINLIDLY